MVGNTDTPDRFSTFPKYCTNFTAFPFIVNSTIVCAITKERQSELLITVLLRWPMMSEMNGTCSDNNIVLMYCEYCIVL